MAAWLSTVVKCEKPEHPLKKTRLASRRSEAQNRDFAGMGKTFFCICFAESRIYRLGAEHVAEKQYTTVWIKRKGQITHCGIKECQFITLQVGAKNLHPPACNCSGMP